jgi:hypothetical protein
MALVARLDKKTGLRVMCGRKDAQGQFTCAGQLAYIAQGGTPGAENFYRSLKMGQGWTENGDGTWSLTRYAQNRLRSANRRLDHGRLTEAEWRQQAAPRFRRDYSPAIASRWLGEDAAAHHEQNLHPPTVDPPLHLPIVAICPKCGQRNTIEAGPLKIVELFFNPEHPDIDGLFADQEGDDPTT